MTVLKPNYILGILFILGIGLIYLIRFPSSGFGLIIQLKHDLIRSIYSIKGDASTEGFEQIATDHCIIKYHPNDRPYIEMVASSAESAYQKVSDFLGQEPKDQVSITIYPDSESLAASFGWDKDEKALGAYWAGAIRILSPRVWVDSIHQQRQFDKDGPLTHELAHLLVDEITYGNYNRWWTEGIAQYVEKKINKFEFSQPASATQPEFYSLQEMEKYFDKLNQSLVYWQSLKVVELIADKYGEDKVFQILYSLREGISMNQAIEINLDKSSEEFESEYYQYLATVWSGV